MLRKASNSFAFKLLAFAVGAILIVSITQAILLIVTVQAQTNLLEKNVTHTAVNSLKQTLTSLGSNELSRTSHLAALPPLLNVKQQQDPQTLHSINPSLIDGELVLILDTAGKVESGISNNTSTILPQTWNVALDLSSFVHNYPYGYVQKIQNKYYLESISPLITSGTITGYVVDAVDLQVFLHQLSSPSQQVQYALFYGDSIIGSTFSNSKNFLPSPQDPSLEVVGSSRFGIFRLNNQDFAVSFINDSSQNPQTNLGVAIETSFFAAQTGNEIKVVIFATILLSLLLGVLAIYFTNRVAIRPLRALAEGAAKVGAGDFSATVNLHSSDDFGKLAATFNSMTSKVQSSNAKLEQHRSRLDSSIRSLSFVSQALTTTTTGPQALREAILSAVHEITGAEAIAMYQGKASMKPVATKGMTLREAQKFITALDLVPESSRDAKDEMELENAPERFHQWSMVVVPMLYQQETVGAIAAFDPFSLEEVDHASLSVLANQATVALENSELFERERETLLRLQELDALKSDFLSTIQHELRTPLTAIVGMTDLLEMCWTVWEDTKKLDALSDVQNAANGLTEIIETILDYSMLESEKVSLTLETCNLKQNVEAVIQELSIPIRKHKAQIDINIPSEIELRIDAIRIRQVIRLILDNAIKFSADPPSIKISATRAQKEVQLDIKDMGIGISSEFHSKIFERFFQVDNTTTRKYGGTGMGLALADKIMDLHKAYISVKSDEGKGSTFTLHFRQRTSLAGQRS
jgi:signal transduction histidine kinase/HAMP domain-containing protein